MPFTIIDELGYLQIVVYQSDVDDVPVEDATTVPISANWAYDHQRTQSVHGIIVCNGDKVVCNSNEVVRTT